MTKLNYQGGRYYFDIWTEAHAEGNLVRQPQLSDTWCKFWLLESEPESVRPADREEENEEIEEETAKAKFRKLEDEPYSRIN